MPDSPAPSIAEPKSLFLLNSLEELYRIIRERLAFQIPNKLSDKLSAISLGVVHYVRDSISGLLGAVEGSADSSRGEVRWLGLIVGQRLFCSRL